MSDLFPSRAHIGSHPDLGMDADTHDHATTDAPYPDLTVTDPAVAGHLWGPDGQTYRTVLYRKPVAFGFVPKEDT